MMSDEIRGARVALGTLAGRIPEQEWELVRSVVRVLTGVESQARNLVEGGLVVPVVHVTGDEHMDDEAAAAAQLH